MLSYNRIASNQYCVQVQRSTGTVAIFSINIIMWINTYNCNKRRKKCWQAISKSYIVIRPVGKGSCRGLFSHIRVTKFRRTISKIEISKYSWPCQVKIQPYFWARPAHSLPFWNFYWKFVKYSQPWLYRTDCQSKYAPGFMSTPDYFYKIFYNMTHTTILWIYMEHKLRVIFKITFHNCKIFRKN